MYLNTNPPTHIFNLPSLPLFLSPSLSLLLLPFPPQHQELCPRQLMSEILTSIHYMPDQWKQRPHTLQVSKGGRERVGGKGWWEEERKISQLFFSQVSRSLSQVFQLTLVSGIRSACTCRTRLGLIPMPVYLFVCLSVCLSVCLYSNNYGVENSNDNVPATYSHSR